MIRWAVAAIIAAVIIPPMVIAAAMWDVIGQYDNGGRRR